MFEKEYKSETFKDYKNSIFIQKRSQKISLDIGKETLKIIDEFANLTENDRSAILEDLIVYSMNPYLDYTESVWKKFLNQKEYKKNKEIEISMKNLLKELEKFRSRHHGLSRENWEEHLEKEVGIKIKREKIKSS